MQAGITKKPMNIEEIVKLVPEPKTVKEAHIKGKK